MKHEESAIEIRRLLEDSGFGDLGQSFTSQEGAFVGN